MKVLLYQEYSNLTKTNKDTLFAAKTISDPEKKQHLIKYFDFVEENGEQNPSNVINKLRSLLNEKNSAVDLSSSVPICILLLFAKLIKQDVVLYKITSESTKTYSIKYKEEECMCFTPMKVHAGFEAATKQSQADEQERQQRIAQSRQNINVGR